MQTRILGAALVLLGTLAAASADDDSTSLQPLAAEDWDTGAAAHLLRRAGFGGTPDEVRELHALGLGGAVDRLLDYRAIDWDTAPPPIDPILLDELDRTELRGLTEEERRELREKRQRAELRTFEEIRLWWLDRMIRSKRPFEEKMTLFWHGHFTSGMREVRDARYMLDQNHLLRKQAVGNFRDLLIGISKDRAMLIYLDNRNNNKRRPNENYARELMELFTLGVGNYSETDVKEAARAFTGWSFNRDGFVFNRRQHDDGKKTFLGKTGNLDGTDVIDIILEQPACARFLARNLLEYFCRPDPDKRLVEGLAGVIRRNKYELKPVMKTLFRSRAFYAADARGSLIRSPIELLVGTARTLGTGVGDLRAAERAVAGMGQEIMQPPNVKGWDGGEKWINTATLFSRYNVVGGLVNGGGRTRPPRRLMRDAASADERKSAADESEPDASGDDDNDEQMMMREMRTEASRLNPKRQEPFDALGVVRAAQLESAEAIVAHFESVFLPVPLPGAKREQLISFLLDGKPQFDVNARDAATRLRLMLHLMMSTPEYQMN